jgi:hypothetical protein
LKLYIFKNMNCFYFFMFQADSCYHFEGELGTSEVPDDIGQRDSSEQAPPEHRAESSVSGGPSGIPSITVTRAAEEAAVTEIEEMPPPQLAGNVTTVTDSIWKFMVVPTFMSQT